MPYSDWLTGLAISGGLGGCSWPVCSRALPLKFSCEPLQRSGSAQVQD
jgi:hypothetical protein